MTKNLPRIKVESTIKEGLDGLKTDDNWTYSLVIDALLEEHAEHKIVMDAKEKKLCDEYKEKHILQRRDDQRVLNDMWKTRFGDEAERTALETEILNLNERDKDFTDELKKQQDAHVELQGALAVKEGELQSVYEENKDLTAAMDELKDKHSGNLSIIQNQCNDFRSRYNNLRDNVNRKYIRTDTIKMLYRVVWFLSRRKRSFFTADQLGNELAYNQDEIETVLTLARHKIFPVRQYLIKNVVCFGFDRRYMK